MSVRRSASGLGVSLRSASVLPTNASIGLRPHAGIAGGAGFFKGVKAHQVSPSNVLSFKASPAGHFAPESIHDRSAATSAADRGGPDLGISGLAPMIFSISKLSPEFPGTTDAPFSPPLSVAASVSSDRPPLAVPALWHDTQRRSSTGATALPKSTSAASRINEVRTAVVAMFAPGAGQGGSSGEGWGCRSGYRPAGAGASGRTGPRASIRPRLR